MSMFGRYLADEGGSVTLWNLFWFTGFCALAGMGIDTTRAQHSKAILQNTADAAAHAALIDLLDPTGEVPASTRMAAALVTASAYGAQNMPRSFYGDVVVVTDVAFGRWENRAFVENTTDPNAVRVFARRTLERGNALSTSFLRVVGLDNWDINTVAVASADIDGVNDCRANGLIAGNLMEQTSNNTMVNDICIHGEAELKINNNNTIECGVVISTPSVASDLKGRWAGKVTALSPCSPDPSDPAYRNPLTESEETMLRHALNDESIPNTAVEEFDNAEILLRARAAGNYNEADDPYGVVPEWVTRVLPNVPSSVFNALDVYVPGTLYEVDCPGNNDIDIKGIVLDVAIVTNCGINFKKSNLSSSLNNDGITGSQKCKVDCDDPNPEPPVGGEEDSTYIATDGGVYPIESGATVVLDNVVILSTATGQNAFKFSNGLQAGRKDGCVAGGAARIYAAGSLQSPADSTWYGAQVISKSDVHLAAKVDGVWGINIEAAGDIKYAAQGRVGACNGQGESDGVFGLRDFEIRLTY